MRITIPSIINTTTGKYYSVASISMLTHEGVFTASDELEPRSSSLTGW